MNDPALKFEFLSLELPDPERSLYPQSQFFTLFSELPVELRLEVWRISLTFLKPRTVDIGIAEYHRRTSQPKKRGWHSRPLKVEKLPVAMWINIESRTEALRHYCLFQHRPMGTQASGITLQPLYLYFNPTHDIICLNYNDMFPPKHHYRYCPPLRDHLPLLAGHATRPLNKIRHLQITHLNLGDVDFRMLFGLTRATERQPVTQRGFWKECIFYFPSLEKITLTPLHWLTPRTILEPMREFLEAHKEKFDTGEAPLVVVPRVL